MAKKRERRRVTWAVAHQRADVRGDDAKGLTAEIDALKLHSASAEGFVVREDDKTILLAEEISDDGKEMLGVSLIPKAAIVQVWKAEE